MLTDALEQIAGMHQMLDMLRDVLRQPLSDATGSYADDLLRETIAICDRFRAGLESIALEGLDQDDQEGWAALLRVARLMERSEMLQQRHREWTGVAGSVGDAAGSAGALGHAAGSVGAAEASLAAGSGGHAVGALGDAAGSVGDAAGSVGALEPAFKAPPLGYGFPGCSGPPLGYGFPGSGGREAQVTSLQGM